jgi:hypothetical protein
MKIFILTLGFLSIIFCCNSQTIHILDFNSSHVIGNTDTTINVVIGDSVLVIHHQDDDDFEVVINEVDTTGAYNILYDNPIFSVKLSNNTINNIKIIYYDPNQYRQIFFNYSTGINYQKNHLAIVHVFPNPAIDRINIDNDEKAIVEFINIQGEIVKSSSLREKAGYVYIADLASGFYIMRINTERGLVIRRLIKK